MNNDLLQLLDGIHRDKNIDKELLFANLEMAIASAARKQYGTDDVLVHVDRRTGGIAASRNGIPIDVKTLGRIAAQTAKQVIIQRIREDERKSLFDEFKSKENDVISGTVSRADGAMLAINLGGRAEGLLPRSEQIPGEVHQVGGRVRCYVREVRESGQQVKIILSRTHPDFIRRLFELEVPEVAERIIEIKALAREAGYRTKIAVASLDAKVDCVGACVGVRGSRIKNIVDELNGEKIDIVRWNDSSQVLIANALKPAEISEIRLCFEFQRATVVVNDDQLSLAIGKRGQNVRLAARLTGWDIDIVTPSEFNEGLQRMVAMLRSIEGVDDVLISKIHALGMLAVTDLAIIEPEAFVEEFSLSPELAVTIQQRAQRESQLIEEERQKAAAAARAAGLRDPMLATAAALGVDAREIIAERAAAESDEDRIRALLLGQRDIPAVTATPSGATMALSAETANATPAMTTPAAPGAAASSSGLGSSGGTGPSLPASSEVTAEARLASTEPASVLGLGASAPPAAREPRPASSSRKSASAERPASAGPMRLVQLSSLPSDAESEASEVPTSPSTPPDAASPGTTLLGTNPQAPDPAVGMTPSPETPQTQNQASASLVAPPSITDEAIQEKPAQAATSREMSGSKPGDNLPGDPPTETGQPLDASAAQTTETAMAAESQPQTPAASVPESTSENLQPPTGTSQT